MHTDFAIESPRQRYLDLVHRYLQGRMPCFTFRKRVREHWAEEREELWRHIWWESREQRCQEREQTENGDEPLAVPDDPRRLARMLDRLCRLCIEGRKEEAFRTSVSELLVGYRTHGSTSPEARFIDYPPRIPVFQRPLLCKTGDRYPCTVEDIRLQLTRVPEYDLEGLWAIGLASLDRSDDNSYGTYYRRFRPMRKPVILLHSSRGKRQFRLHFRSDPGYIKWWFKVECSCGLEIDCTGGRAICTWHDEHYRRYVVEHVLLHEIGHHVQYQERWRSGYRRWLRSPVKEQFAEDYAIGFNREKAE